MAADEDFPRWTPEGGTSTQDARALLLPLALARGAGCGMCRMQRLPRLAADRSQPKAGSVREDGRGCAKSVCPIRASEQSLVAWPRGDWESQSRILLGRLSRSSRLHCAVRARLRLLPIASESSCRMWRPPSGARVRFVRTARQSTRTRARASRNVPRRFDCAARKRRGATLEDQGIARN